MLDTLKALFKKELSMAHTSGVLTQVANLVNIVDAQYLKDGKDAKNTAIDVICKLLQDHKNPEEQSDQPAEPLVP